MNASNNDNKSSWPIIIIIIIIIIITPVTMIRISRLVGLGMPWGWHLELVRHCPIESNDITSPWWKIGEMTMTNIWPSRYHIDITLISLVVGGFKHGFYFPFHIWVVILPIDEVHHFSRWLSQPPARISLVIISHWYHPLLYHLSSWKPVVFQG